VTDGFRILVVEDSETQALKLCALLEEQGWTTILAPTAQAALEELSREIPDLMIVDYYLPGMRGDELCRRVRMNVDTRDLLTLMLTVEEDESAHLRGLESGADDYLPKSTDDDVLLLRVQALLRKAQAHSAVLGTGETSFRQARILAIDDSPTYLAYVTGELIADGYQVEGVSSGAEGLELIRQKQFDCVLVDLVMPGLDGVEVCRQITEHRRTLDNPLVVLILTAHESKEEMTRGLAAGADDFVGKSSDMAVLKARIRALLRRKFFQEENERILQELKQRELEAVRSRAEKDAAVARAVLGERLKQAHEELQEAHLQLKQTQVQLVHSEKMASLGQLVAGIAHEINNPLAFVVNNLYVLGERLDELAAPQGLGPETPEMLRRMRTRVSDSVDGLARVQELVMKLRTFSRIDEGEFKVVDVHEGIESALLFLGHRLGERIQVTKTYTPSGVLGCYAGQLNQVMMNILSNAIDAIERDGTIAITTSRDDGWFSISVRDTGKGMPADVRHRLFEPFFTTKPVGKGTGLGMAISDTIMRMHQGEIRVSSEDGKGAEFVVRIPVDLERRLSDGST
jgi:two-component system, NtrC family, sensor kinase